MRKGGKTTAMAPEDFISYFRALILLTWTLPPIVGLSFLIFIKMFTTGQVMKIIVAPLEASFVLGALAIAVWYFSRIIRPITDFLAGRREMDAADVQRVLRSFMGRFWGAFLLYLLVAPATVIISAESHAGFVPQTADWVRIHLVALIVSIVVGLPIFFLFFDLMGRVLGGIRLTRAVLTIKTKVFLIGSLVPLLIDTMLVQYYWTRTGYFSGETFLVWLFLELLAIGGTLIFVRSFNQSLLPLHGLVAGHAADGQSGPDVVARSTDELGVMAGRYRGLLDHLYLHSEVLEIGNRILRSGGKSASLAEAIDRIIEICQTALNADITFLILYDETSGDLVGVAQTGVSYDPQGHFRIPAQETALSSFIFREGRPVAIDDAETDPRVSPRMIEQFGIRSAVGAPLEGEGGMLGVLMSITTHKKRRFTAKEVTLVAELAREAATVVHTMTLNERRRHAEERFRQADELARVTLQSIGDGVMATDVNGNVELLNAVAEKLTRWSNTEARGRPWYQVLRLVEESTTQPIPDPVQCCIEQNKNVTCADHTLLLDRSDDQSFSVEVRVSPIRDDQGEVRGAVLVFHDVSELRLLTRKLSYQARHDDLTGLINRREFEVYVETALERARTEGGAHALCYIDLDQFKVVNDTCGHVAGDELLKQLTARLRTVIRDADTLGRLGGDEFGLLLQRCPLEKAKEIAEGLLMLARGFRFMWEGKAFDVGMSIGLVPITADGGTITDVLSAADSACYVAKDLGRNRLHVFEEDDLALAQRQGEMQWLPRIRQALEENLFELYIQPIMPVNASLIECERYGEILLRMRGADGEIIAPASFLPAAERYHLMPAIDRWVVKNAVMALRARQPLSGVTCRYAINLSGQSLCDDDFLEFVLHQLAVGGIDPKSICFEITETTAIANLTRAKQFIAALKEKGCRFALDDFGSGLSSFGYLKNLPVDYVKIDGSFVKDMDDSPIDRAMVEAINQIGHLMGIQTIAEYVVSDAVFKALQELGVDYAQGFFLAKPRPLDEMPETAIRTASKP